MMFETAEDAKEIIGEMTLDRFSEAERWALNMALNALQKQVLNCGQTPEEFKQEMQRILMRNSHYEKGVYTTYPETVHIDMDELMCKLLRELGYGDGVDIFEKTEKWYS